MVGGLRPDQDWMAGIVPEFQVESSHATVASSPGCTWGCTRCGAPCSTFSSPAKNAAVHIAVVAVETPPPISFQTVAGSYDESFGVAVRFGALPHGVVHREDLTGLEHLAIDATGGLTDVDGPVPAGSKFWVKVDNWSWMSIELAASVVKFGA